MPQLERPFPRHCSCTGQSLFCRLSVGCSSFQEYSIRRKFLLTSDKWGTMENCINIRYSDRYHDIITVIIQ